MLLSVFYLSKHTVRTFKPETLPDIPAVVQRFIEHFQCKPQVNKHKKAEE